MNRILVSLLILVTLCGTPPFKAIAADYRNYRKPEDVVAWLYRDYAFDAIMSEYWKDASLIQQPENILRLYFTNELTSLILKDRQCVERTHEICNLDFDPIFASQDPGAADLKISPLDSSGVVHVQFTYPSNGEKINLSYAVVKTKSGWRIKDIIYKEGRSLGKLLRGQE